MMHIELEGNSLAECYARFKNLDYIQISDLCHKARVMIDKYLDFILDRMEFVPDITSDVV